MSAARYACRGCGWTGTVLGGRTTDTGDVVECCMHCDGDDVVKLYTATAASVIVQERSAPLATLADQATGGSSKTSPVVKVL